MRQALDSLPKRWGDPSTAGGENRKPATVPRIFESIPKGAVPDGFWAYYGVDSRNASINPEERLVGLVSDIQGFVHASGRVLSVGCGYGLDEIILSFLSPDVEVVGIDIPDDRHRDTKIRSMGRVAALLNADRVTSLLADGGELPFRNGTFDAVLAIDSLSHADYAGVGRDLEEGQARLLVEMARVLRSGGKMGIVENSAASPRNVMRKGRTSCHPVNPFYLRSTLDGLGFEKVRIAPYYNLTDRSDARARIARAVLRRSNTLGLLVAPLFILSASKRNLTPRSYR